MVSFTRNDVSLRSGAAWQYERSTVTCKASRGVRGVSSEWRWEAGSGQKSDKVCVHVKETTLVRRI